MINLKLLSGLFALLVATMIWSTLTIRGAIHSQSQGLLASRSSLPSNKAGDAALANSGHGASAHLREDASDLQAIRANLDKETASLAEIVNYLSALDLPTKNDRAGAARALGMPPGMMPGMPPR